MLPGQIRLPGDPLKRRQFLHAAAASSLAFAPWEAISTETRGATQPLAAASERPLRTRFDLTLNRVLHQDQPAYSEAFLLQDVIPTPGRRFTEYSGDVSGRYIGALATASRVYALTFPGLDELVRKVLRLQKPDGYFGSGFHNDKPTDLDLALLWGNGRLLVGLLEYERFKPSPEVRAACVRLGDWLVKIAPLMMSKETRTAFGAQHFASSYICWTQQSEGLANLYILTGDERYRRLTESIVDVTERRPGDHVHGYLTSLRGWLDLYKATRDAQLLAKAETAWRDVAASQDLLVTGGVPEGWSPNNHRTEGCGEADWLRFSLGLWKATGKPEYLEMAEKTAFNEFSFNQYSTGDFGHRVFTPTGLPASGAVRAWWCCTLHGLRCFPDIQESAFRPIEEGVAFDIPVDAEIGVPGFAAASSSTLAADGQMRIEIKKSDEAMRGLSLRKPAWARDLQIRVNGEPQHVPVKSGYALVRRKWQRGDVVTIGYGMTLRTEPAPEKRITYWVGPWLLGAPASENAAFFNEMTLENKLDGAASASEAKATGANPVGDNLAEASAFQSRHAAEALRVPIAARSLSYVPAEYPSQPGKVNLRPIAEQTGQSTTSWEIRFQTTGRV